MTQAEAEARFHSRFTAAFAVLLVVLTFMYLAAITFLPMAAKAERFADTILGVLLAGVIGAVVKHFYDSSRSSQANQAALREIASSPTVPPTPAPDTAPQPPKD